MTPPLHKPLVAVVTHGARLAAAVGASPADVEDLLVRQARDAAAAGVDLLVVRELDLGGAALFRLVERAVAAARSSPLRVLVNDRFDVARAAGAGGVHLRGDSYPAPRVRAVAPPGFLVGRSVHDAEEAAGVVAAGGVDYLFFGTVFPSASKPAPHAPAGVGALEGVVRAAWPVPVLAIGGVSIATAPALAAAGASGVAAIGLFLPGPGAGAASFGETVGQLRAVFDSTGEPH